MRILGIFGHPVSHSLSPKMHNAALEAVGLEKEFIYLKFDILPHDLKTAINALKVLNAKGVNITIPYKEAVIPFLDGLDMSAQAVNGVNVIVNDNGRLIGYNTDGIGFIRSLKEESGVNPQGKKVLVLGAGGAAKSVCAALAAAGTREIVIVNRTIERAESAGEIVRKIGCKVRTYDFSRKKFNDLTEEISSSSIIINTTSVGLYPPDQSLLTDFQDFLHQDQVVADIIYLPKETLLLKQAKRKGCVTLSGAGMLIYQGAEAFRLWTGLDAPVDIMKKVLEEELKNVD
ncbi:MAG: shikimate dehydrogenase [Bacillota bacterium]|jgi:shikimate dehydrogenase